MSWLGSLIFSRLSGTLASRSEQRQRPKVHLQLEFLEDRTLLNNRFVVPAALADNVTNFATLSSALTTAGLNSGDVIQIEPGSSPGDVSSAAGLPSTFTSLTIQGDPTAPRSAIPGFTVSGSFDLTATQNNFTLKNVNITVTSAGEFTFPANASILNSSITDSSTSATGITLSGASNTLSASTLVANNSSITNLVLLQPPSGASDSITGNTFETVSGVGAGGGLVSYQLGAANVGVTDQIFDNNFLSAGGSFAGVHVLVPTTATSVLNGLTVLSNNFNDSSMNVDAGVFFEGPVQNAVVQSNVIHFMVGDGVLVYGGSAAAVTVSAVINGNAIMCTADGFGIFVAPGTLPTNAVNVTVEGNDLHNTTVGVGIGSASVTGRAGPLSGIDLGGGSQGSLGGNDFRSFTAAATGGSGAILLDTTDAAGAGTIAAQKNIFASGVTPGNEVFPNNSAQIDVSNPLTGNAAFVASLYSEVLRRAGDGNNSTDAGSWIAALAAGTLTQAQAASGIIHSTEAGGVVADQLYLLLLDRAPNAAEQNQIATLLGGGGTEEQAINQVVTSPEYSFDHGSDSDFVQSLYLRLLGRVGSPSEVAGWLTTLSSMSRTEVANDFLNSTEFRYDVVNQIYGFHLAPVSSAASTPAPLLHRLNAPGMAEIDSWLFSGLDMLGIEAGIAGSPEFFSNG